MNLILKIYSLFCVYIFICFAKLSGHFLYLVRKENSLFQVEMISQLKFGIGLDILMLSKLVAAVIFYIPQSALAKKWVRVSFNFLGSFLHLLIVVYRTSSHGPNTLTGKLALHHSHWIGKPHRLRHRQSGKGLFYFLGQYWPIVDFANVCSWWKIIFKAVVCTQILLTGILWF